MLYGPLWPQVNWGELDFLIVDTPPGTSDEHLSIVQYMKGAGIDGAVVVTTPQEIAMQDVRKEINFCKKVRRLVLKHCVASSCLVSS